MYYESSNVLWVTLKPLLKSSQKVNDTKSQMLLCKNVTIKHCSINKLQNKTTLPKVGFYNNKNYFPFIPAYLSCTMHCSYHDEIHNYLAIVDTFRANSRSICRQRHNVQTTGVYLTTRSLITVLNTEIHVGQKVC